jgi:hypothetical protein
MTERMTNDNVNWPVKRKTYEAGDKKIIDDESCSKTTESDEKRKVCGLNNNSTVVVHNRTQW